MFIWRVENNLGYGPYHVGDAFGGVNLLNPKEHPEPRQDIPEWRNIDYPFYKAYHFGFRSMKDLTEWFHGSALERLYGQGYKIVKYDIPVKTINYKSIPLRTVLVGGKQVAFMIDYANKVLTHNKCKRFLRYKNGNRPARRVVTRNLDTDG